MILSISEIGVHSTAKVADILSKVSLWNNISKEELVKMLSKI